MLRATQNAQNPYSLLISRPTDSQAEITITAACIRENYSPALQIIQYIELCGLWGKNYVAAIRGSNIQSTDDGIWKCRHAKRVPTSTEGAVVQSEQIHKSFVLSLQTTPAWNTGAWKNTNSLCAQVFHLHQPCTNHSVTTPSQHNDYEVL